MAKIIYKDVTVTVNSVDLTDHVTSVELTMEAEDVDVTAMGATARQRMPGLRADALTINFLQDFAAAKVDQTLYPIFAAGTAVDIVIKPTSSAVSTVNPSFTANAYLLSYQPIRGSVGDRAEVSVDFALTNGITRATS